MMVYWQYPSLSFYSPTLVIGQCTHSPPPLSPSVLPQPQCSPQFHSCSCLSQVKWLLVSVRVSPSPLILRIPKSRFGYSIFFMRFRGSLLYSPLLPHLLYALISPWDTVDLTHWHLSNLKWVGITISFSKPISFLSFITQSLQGILTFFFSFFLTLILGSLGVLQIVNGYYQ